MEIPWDTSFALFTCLSAVLLAAAGVATLLQRQQRLHKLMTFAALASIACGIASGCVYLGHPERIFGAFANPGSVLSREMMAVLASASISAFFLHRLFRDPQVSRALSVVAVLAGVVLMATTAQLIGVWTS